MFYNGDRACALSLFCFLFIGGQYEKKENKHNQSCKCCFVFTDDSFGNFISNT